MMAWVHRLLSDDHGQDLIEYALLSTFIALLCIAGVNLLESALSTVFSVIAAQLGTD